MNQAPAIDATTREARRALDRYSAASLLHVSYLNAGTRTRVDVYPSGVVVTPPTVGMDLGRGGRRGNVISFSKASRARLKRKLVSLDFAANAWTFCTLTYPGEYPASSERWKENLNAFRSALLRDWSDVFVGSIWRLERQTRGAPHYHLLLCWRTRPPIRLLRAWVRKSWTRLLDDLNRNANWVRSEVQPVKLHGDNGHAKLLHYLAKYLGKTSNPGWLIPETGEVISPGRMWGEWGKLPYAQAETYLLELEEAEQLLARVHWTFADSRYLANLETERFRGVFWGNPETWKRMLTDLPRVTRPP